MSTITRLLRTVQLDESDVHVYDRTASPGEWAITGSFAFWDVPLETLAGKQRQAFRHGFLGTESFGWATLTIVATITPDEAEQLISRLARHLVDHYGAPDLAAALPVAREEIEFAAGLCEHPVNTLLALERDFEGDQITESFKVVRPPSAAGHDGLRIWEIIDACEAENR